MFACTVGLSISVLLDFHAVLGKYILTSLQKNKSQSFCLFRLIIHIETQFSVVRGVQSYRAQKFVSSLLCFETWMSAVLLASWQSMGEGQIFTAVLYTTRARFQFILPPCSMLVWGFLSSDVRPFPLDNHNKLESWMQRRAGTKVVIVW